MADSLATVPQVGGQNTLRVVVWILFTCEVLALISRLALKRDLMGIYGWDDGMAILALLFSLAASVAADVAAIHGLGSDRALVFYDSRVIVLQKCAYASEVFHVLSLCAVKMSMTFLIKKLFSTPSSSHFRSRIFLTAMGLTGGWGVSALLVVAFQCSPPDRWNLVLGSCIDMTAFWISFSVFNIVFDLAILIFPGILSWNLLMPLQNKAIIIGCFTPCVVAVGVSAASIAFSGGFNTAKHANPITIGSDLWPWFICSQVLRAVCIISACVPYLRKFVEALPSGLMQPDEIRRHGLTYADILHGYAAHHSENDNGEIIYYLRELDPCFNQSHREDNVQARSSPPGQDFTAHRKSLKFNASHDPEA